MRRQLTMAAVIIAASAASAMSAPATAQDSDREKACLHASQTSRCEMSRDELDTLYRHRDWDANVKRNEEAAAQRRQLTAEARDRADRGSLSRLDQVMRRRRAAAQASGN